MNYWICFMCFVDIFGLNKNYCNHFGGFESTLTVGDSNPSLGNIEPRPGRIIMPSVSCKDIL